MDEYYHWLLDKVGCIDEKAYKYDRLLRYLHSVEFVYSIGNDRNRAIDGLNLRDDFMSENNLRGYIEGPCSVLEMLVAFSIRIEICITGEPGNDDFGRWFWVMLRNLELIEPENGREGCKNEYHFDLEEVKNRVNKFLFRGYDRNGRGGVFPLSHSKTNLREVELWYQMQWYLSEHDW